MITIFTFQQIYLNIIFFHANVMKLKLNALFYYLKGTGWHYCVKKKTVQKWVMVQQNEYVWIMNFL